MMTKERTICKAQYPDLIRAVYGKYERGSWVYADLVAVAEEMGISLYPSLMLALRMSGWINPVSEGGAVLRRQGHGKAYGPKYWAVSSAGAKKAGVAGVTA